ncbi:MAG: c-type cytochrome [Gemmataceae bacterium]|nr:c-type cytochrome [Gemmataceae bacterium]
MNAVRFVALVAVGLLAASLRAGEPSASERGKAALETRTFNPAPWPLSAYGNAWKHWQPPLKQKPADYDQAFRDYYGLHPAPYANKDLPMGLRHGSRLFTTGIANDCMICHGGSILGKSYVGLGNASLDIHTLFEDFNKVSGLGKLPFVFSNARGTSEAGGMAVYLLALREPDLSLRLTPLELGLKDDLCEDTPAWWLLKKKKSMYHIGSSDARSVRSIMQFMMTPLNGRTTFEKEEKTFADIQAFLLSMEAPKYPFPMDRELADKGKMLFEKSCVKCHGTYGPEWTYPNRIVPLDEIGTDPARFHGISRKAGEHYNRSWFAQEKGQEGYLARETNGYQAPPLDGVWATAPYFHNGSAPTLEDVLNSKTRPKIYTRSFRTGEEDYEQTKVGWKVQVLDKAPAASEPGVLRRRVYDTTQPGRGNGGHTYGDALTPDERRAVIEYLKSL